MEPLPAAAMVGEPHGSTSRAEGSGVLGAGRLSARSASRVWEAEGSEPATAHPQTQGALTILVGNVEGLQQCARWWQKEGIVRHCQPTVLLSRQGRMTGVEAAPPAGSSATCLTARSSAICFSRCFTGAMNTQSTE